MLRRWPQALSLAIAALAAPLALACGEGGLSLRALLYDAGAVVRAVPLREVEDDAGRFVDLRIDDVLIGEIRDGEIRVWTPPRSVAAESGFTIGRAMILGIHRPEPGEYFADPRFLGAAIPVAGGAIPAAESPGLESALRKLVPAARAARAARGRGEESDPLRPMLPGLLADPDARIRRFAIDAYAGAGARIDASEIRILLDTFRRESDPWVARGFVDVFRRAKVREAAALLIPHALDGEDLVLAEEATRALGEIGDRKVAAGLLPGVLTGPAERRGRAIRVLGALRIPETAGVLRLGLVDSETREAAIEALGDLGTSEAVEALERAAAGRTARVRTLAAEALARARTPQADAALRRLAAGDRGLDPVSRAGAIERFRSFGRRDRERGAPPATRR